jgi:hypothetical protein
LARKDGLELRNAHRLDEVLVEARVLDLLALPLAASPSDGDQAEGAVAMIGTQPPSGCISCSELPSFTIRIAIIATFRPDYLILSVAQKPDCLPLIPDRLPPARNHNDQAEATLHATERQTRLAALLTKCIQHKTGARIAWKWWP